MSKRKSKIYNILIVCEGERSEPNYFQAISEEVIKQGIWTNGVAITIRPKPLIITTIASVPSSHKKRRNRRKVLKEIAPNPNDQRPDIEEEYKADPVRYVREAQKGLDDDTFDEVWAVFDKDDHPRHQQAFKLADTLYNGKKVNIAFSSIAIEHWFLLHFERNIFAFSKSECKEKPKPKKKKKSINCGTGKHHKDCYGETCVAGYLKKCSYLPTYVKGATNVYNLLKSKTEIALVNASWLRQQNKGKYIYTLNPYTDVDELVKRLLKIETKIVWLAINTVKTVSDLRIEITSPPSLSISITNQKSIGFFCHKKVTYFSDEKRIRQEAINLGVIDPSDTKILPLSIPHSTTELCIDLEGYQVRVLL